MLLTVTSEFNSLVFSFKVAFAAFSIGGKIVLKVFEMNPERVESLWLFAPDGLKNNMWYNLAVYPAWGRKIFRYLIDSPKLAVGMLKLLRWINVFPENSTLLTLYSSPFKASKFLISENAMS